eukprot:UN21456
MEVETVETKPKIKKKGSRRRTVTSQNPSIIDFPLPLRNVLKKYITNESQRKEILNRFTTWALGP